jgi:osmotically-inducible protein OsmY
MNDRDLQSHVQHALDWDPSVDAAEIGVTVDQGVVTLRGDVKTYAEKAAAERIALHVYGVKAVANDVEVHVIQDGRRTDSAIATAAVNALSWNTQVPVNRVSVAVDHGWITLKGEVEWNFQRTAAERAVRDLLGVVGVVNAVTVRPRVSAPDVASKIEAALKRSAEVDAKRIHVSAMDGKVTLTGNVRSWFERREAADAAWSAPGVREIDNRIAVTP